MQAAVKLSGCIVLIIGWFGFVLPYLVSAHSDILVVTGISVTVFAALAVLVYIVKTCPPGRKQLGLEQPKQRRNKRNKKGNGT